MTFRAPAAALLAALALTACRDEAPAAPAFIGSRACAKCHEERHESWMATGHAYALQVADEKTVLGTFDGTPHDHPKYVVTPLRDPDGTYRMVVERKAEGTQTSYRVDRAIGVGIQQAYLRTSPEGEWQLLHLTWNVGEKRWQFTGDVLGEISADPGRYPDFHPESHGFNHGCAGCHATGFDPGFDERKHTYAPKMVEGSIACESCHGPGSAHAVRHERPLKQGDSYESPERLLHPGADTWPGGPNELCARCHDFHWFRYALDDDPRAGPRDVAVTQGLDDFGFGADGRFTGLQYDWTVMKDSLCVTKGGLTCLHCHDVHGGHPKAMRRERGDDDAMCAPCHADLVTDPKPHTRHADQRCVACHMPKLLGGLLSAQRDHSIRSPEPELTRRFGAANGTDACTHCHKDHDAAWAAEWRAKWWKPTAPAEVARAGLVVRLRRTADDVGTAELLATALDTSARSFHRLTALRASLTRPGTDVDDAIVKLLGEAHHDVRHAAVAAAAERLVAAAAPGLRPLLRDRDRTTRVEAAYALARLGWRGDDPEMRAAYADARLMLDRRHVFDDAWIRLATLADALGDEAEFDRFADSLARMPSWKSGPPDAPARAVLHRRGRRLFEDGRAEEAVTTLRTAAGPSRPADLLMLDLLETEDRRAGRTHGELWMDLAGSATDPAVAAIAAFRSAVQYGRGAEERKRLEALATTLRTDPVGGERLRRVDAALRGARAD